MLGYRSSTLLRIKRFHKSSENEKDILVIFCKVSRNNSLYMLAVPVPGKSSTDIP